MKKLLFTISVFSLVFTSCKEKIVESQPADLFPRDSMVQVMKEITLVEAVYQKRMINTLNQRDSATTLFAEILAENNISQERFTRSYTWYKRTPQEAEKLFDDIITELSKLDATVKSTAEDSLIEMTRTAPPTPHVLNADSLRQQIIQKQRDKRKQKNQN